MLAKLVIDEVSLLIKYLEFLIKNSKKISTRDEAEDEATDCGLLEKHIDKQNVIIIAASRQGI